MLVVVRPGRRPPSTSARRAQGRSASAVSPTLAEIAVMAAHSERYSSQCSTNILTARSRTSAEYVYFYALLHPLKGRSLQDSRGDSL